MALLGDVIKALADQYTPCLSRFDEATIKLWDELKTSHFDDVRIMNPADMKGLAKGATLPSILSLNNVIRTLKTLWAAETSPPPPPPLQVEFASGQWFMLCEAAGTDAATAAASIARALEADCETLLLYANVEFARFAELVNWGVHPYSWREHLDEIRALPPHVEARAGPGGEGLFEVRGCNIQLKTPSPSCVADGAHEAFIARVIPYSTTGGVSRSVQHVVRVSPVPQGMLAPKLLAALVCTHTETPTSWKDYVFSARCDAETACKYFRQRGFIVVLRFSNT